MCICTYMYTWNCIYMLKLSNSLETLSTNINAESLLKFLKKLSIQLGFEPRTF